MARVTAAAREAAISEFFAGTDTSLMVTAAHRYCLGRSSYIVGSCVDWLSRHWPRLAVATRNVILRDTAEALARGESGMDQDARDWRGFLAFAWREADAASRGWVRDAVRHVEGAEAELDRLGG